LAAILRADQAAGAVHVLDHEVGRAVDVLDQMLGENPALDISGPAGGEVDQHREPLALVVGLLRMRVERHQRDRGISQPARSADEAS
jgi:hypothetical protein